MLHALLVLLLAAAEPGGSSGSAIQAEPVPHAAPHEAPHETAKPMIVGGYAAMSPHAPELRAVAKVAIARVSPTTRAGARLVAAERQIVAGTNYRLQIKLRDGSQWRVIVWRRLDRSLVVTEVEQTDQS